ncbi:MAG: 3-oxoacyl-[acyl-carrier-protein] reductase [Chromatiales bacterium]|nr:3-oxoacyl-[acyl-carrier-protein] reductase [Chromatiales bacterium]
MTETPKIALVTGASRGIGAAILKTLMNDTLEIYGTATTDAGAKAISAIIKTANAKGSGLVMRVDKEDSIAQVAEYLKQQNKMPDIIINNAGITRDNLLLRMSYDDWQEVINTNLTSVYRVTKMFIKKMIKNRWGRIINITSVIASIGNAGQSNYAAAKSGMLGLTKSLAKELAARNITVNNIAPGFIDTDMTASLSAEQRQALLQNIPLRRFGVADEVGFLTRFLISEDAGYITGETIHINGGMYMP